METCTPSQSTVLITAHTRLRGCGYTHWLATTTSYSWSMKGAMLFSEYRWRGNFRRRMFERSAAMRDVIELVRPSVTLQAGFLNRGFFPSLVCTAAQILFAAPQTTGEARRRAVLLVCKTRSFETKQNMVSVVVLSVLTSLFFSSFFRP